MEKISNRTLLEKMILMAILYGISVGLILNTFQVSYNNHTQSIGCRELTGCAVEGHLTDEHRS